MQQEKNGLKIFLVCVGVIVLIAVMYKFGASSATPANTAVQPTHMMDDGTAMPGMRHGQ
ncbi:MAG: hypothetical protein AAB776_03780 [Patescibacteria group bacterium]